MGMMQPTLQQILAGFDYPRWLLTPGEICSGSRVSGARVFSTLHRFMVGMSRETLRHGGQCGSAMDPMVWHHGIRTHCA